MVKLLPILFVSVSAFAANPAYTCKIATGAPNTAPAILPSSSIVIAADQTQADITVSQPQFQASLKCNVNQPGSEPAMMCPPGTTYQGDQTLGDEGLLALDLQAGDDLSKFIQTNFIDEGLITAMPERAVLFLNGATGDYDQRYFGLCYKSP